MTKKEYEILSEALRLLKIRIENAFDNLNEEIKKLNDL